MSYKDRKAVCLETGIQNYALVLSIVALSFNGCYRTNALSVPLITTLLYTPASTITVFILLLMNKFHKNENENKNSKLDNITPVNNA